MLMLNKMITNYIVINLFYIIINNVSIFQFFEYNYKNEMVLRVVYDEENVIFAQNGTSPAS